jgi:hypothetical protein
MLQAPEKYRDVERRWESAPKFPVDRPPTKAEVWAFYSHIYKNVKTDAELKSQARTAWALKYIFWWMQGWRKQPDWVEGDAVIEAAVPHRISLQNYERAVYDAWDVAQERKAA